MVRNLKDRFLDNSVLAQIWIMNVIMATIELRMEDVFKMTLIQPKETHMDSQKIKSNNVKLMGSIQNHKVIEEFQETNV